MHTLNYCHRTCSQDAHMKGLLYSECLHFKYLVNRSVGLCVVGEAEDLQVKIELLCPQVFWSLKNENQVKEASENF